MLEAGPFHRSISPGYLDGPVKASSARLRRVPRCRTPTRAPPISITLPMTDLVQEADFVSFSPLQTSLIGHGIVSPRRRFHFSWSLPRFSRSEVPLFSTDRLNPILLAFWANLLATSPSHSKTIRRLHALHVAPREKFPFRATPNKKWS